MEQLSSRSRILLLALASGLLWIDAAALYRDTRPHFGAGTVEFAAQSGRSFAYPFHQKKLPRSKFVLRESMDLAPQYPVIYTFFPKDTLWSIKVNGHDVNSRSLPLSYVDHEGRSVSLAPFLHSGHNDLEFDMEVYWGEASLNFYESPWDKWSVIILTLISLAAMTTGTLLIVLFGMKMSPGEAAILLGGFLLRYIYVSGTPYFIRSYDWWGHEAYLDYVIQHLSLPDPHSGWETYQPPLYYIALGGATRFLTSEELSEGQRFVIWQAFSLVCSSGILLAGFWIGKLLYEEQIRPRLYLLAILGVAPALVFNASRVSNDVLLNLLEFLWLGCLLEFWTHPQWRWKLGLSLVLGMALITKASALALIPISLACILIVPHTTIKRRFVMSVSLVLIALAIASGYYLPRAFGEVGFDSYFVGNIHHLNPKGHIDGILAKSMVFNPFQVLRYPFAEPWGPRHEYFLEYFFKSIFLGEWFLGHAYRWIARALILTALLVIPVFLRGMWDSWKNQTGCDYPLLVTLFGVFAAQWAFLQVAPFMSSQDFRYSVILLVPLAYFLIRGVSILAHRWQQVALFGLQIVILNSAIYLIELALEG